MGVVSFSSKGRAKTRQTAGIGMDHTRPQTSGGRGREILACPPWGGLACDVPTRREERGSKTQGLSCFAGGGLGPGLHAKRSHDHEEFSAPWATQTRTGRSSEPTSTSQDVGMSSLSEQVGNWPVTVDGGHLVAPFEHALQSPTCSAAAAADYFGGVGTAPARTGTGVSVKWWCVSLCLPLDGWTPEEPETGQTVPEFRRRHDRRRGDEIPFRRRERVPFRPADGAVRCWTVFVCMLHDQQEFCIERRASRGAHTRSLSKLEPPSSGGQQFRVGDGNGSDLIRSRGSTRLV